MTYGITGNPTKERLWDPLADLVSWLLARDLPFCLHRDVARGLAERGLVGDAVCDERSTPDLASEADLVLSFGGDGTLLRTAHELGTEGAPILGVNIGRLGFLADIQVGQVQDAILELEEGAFSVEARMALDIAVDGVPADELELPNPWALNEFVLDRSGAAGLIRIEVKVDGTPLNTYWADGLIVATPTGSTAYSLSTGGPIIAPGSGVVILTPIAPHTLTVRPIVLPASVEIEASVREGCPYVLAADGRSTVFEREGVTLRIRRAAHAVPLVKLHDQHFFQTLRSKLMWGAHETRFDDEERS